MESTQKNEKENAGSTKVVVRGSAGVNKPGIVRPGKATGRRGVLHWGETLETVFMAVGNTERLQLAEKVQDRPDDPIAWAAVLEHASNQDRSGTSGAGLCKLYRRATQCINKDRPEVKESEAYVSIWIGFAHELIAAGKHADAAATFQFLRNEGIGKRSPQVYLAWAKYEAAAGRCTAARDALRTGARSVATQKARAGLNHLLSLLDDTIFLAGLKESDALALTIDQQKEVTATTSTRQSQQHQTPAETTVTTTARWPPHSTATSSSSDEATRTEKRQPRMSREDIDYMLRWQPGQSQQQRSAQRRVVGFTPVAMTPANNTGTEDLRSQTHTKTHEMKVPISSQTSNNHTSLERLTSSTKPILTETKSQGNKISSKHRQQKSKDDSSASSSDDSDDTPSRRAKAQAKERLFNSALANDALGQIATIQPVTETVNPISAFTELVSARNMVLVDDTPYLKLALVGRGGSSKVFRVLDAEGRIFALKRIKLKGPDAQDNLLGYANEITLLRRLKGKPGIIDLHAAQVDVKHGSINMIMEAGEADLATVLSQRAAAAATARAAAQNKFSGNNTTTHTSQGPSYPPLDHGNFVRLAWQQMLEAVGTIHDDRIVHGDLKPANFLFVQGRLRLIDFGIARAIKNDTTNIYRDTQIGTLNYMSPEAIHDTNPLNHQRGNTRNIRMGHRGPAHKPKMRVGRASDVWSLGCILYQMLYGRPPFGHLNLYAKLQAIANPNHEIDIPDAPLASDDAIDCLRGCLQREPSARPDIEALLHHRFLEPPVTTTPDLTVDRLAAVLNLEHVRSALGKDDDLRGLAQILYASLQVQALQEEEDATDLIVATSTDQPLSSSQQPVAASPDGADAAERARRARRRRRSIVDRRENRLRAAVAILEDDEDEDDDSEQLYPTHRPLATQSRSHQIKY